MGVVTLDDVPVEGVSLTFHPEKDSTDAQPGDAFSDKSGRFRAMTLQPDDGLFPGDDKVTVSKTAFEPYSPAEYSALEGSGQGAPGAKMIEYLPIAYKDVEKTPLTVTFDKKGSKTVQFSLSSEFK